MPELRLFPLDEILNTSDLDAMMRQLKELGVEEVATGDDIVDLEGELSDEQLTDFLDRLEAHDIACDIYLPAEFEGILEVGDRCVGSAYALSEALEELRAELDLDSDDESEDDPSEEMELEVVEQQLGYAWQAFAKAVAACTSRQIPLHVMS